VNFWQACSPHILGANHDTHAMSGDRFLQLLPRYFRVYQLPMASREDMAEAPEPPVISKLKNLHGERLAEARLSLPYPARLTVATTLSFLVGATLGLSHGAQTAGLRFRAENAHRLPQTSTGWYFYHKSKNYHMAFGGVKEGMKMGIKVSAWVAAFFALEEYWDRIRGEKDFLNTVMSSLSVAGGFSLWSMSGSPVYG
jgi:hypothetical protein